MWKWYNNVPKFEDNALICPFCGGNNLHQETISTYNRAEDAEECTVTRVDAFGTRVFREETYVRNPSARRQGLVIGFMCEHCHGIDGEEPAVMSPVIELEIIQHKGCTYIQWKKEEADAIS